MQILSPKILVVDDDPDICELLEYNFTKEGYEVKTAANGALALEIAPHFLPDIILMDIMMPVMDGIETGRRIISGKNCGAISKANAPFAAVFTSYPSFVKLYSRSSQMSGSSSTTKIFGESICIKAKLLFFHKSKLLSPL